MKMIVAALALASGTFAYGQDAASCPMRQQHQANSVTHAMGVDERGDHAMGFSHETTTHHFHLLRDGGTIEVTAKKSDDTATQDEIRTHLSHITQMFSAGDFDVPAFIHDTNPQGVDVMKAKREAISYTYQRMPSGGEVRIRTSDPEALKAVHEFLQFQIKEHRTGDSMTTESEDKTLPR